MHPSVPPVTRSNGRADEQLTRRVPSALTKMRKPPYASRLQCMKKRRRVTLTMHMSHAASSSDRSRDELSGRPSILAIKEEVICAYQSRAVKYRL